MQHATARYHLGTLLLQLDRLEEAETELRAAADLFASRLPVEHAMAMNALGAALRAKGDYAGARHAFLDAAEAFERQEGRELEEGAAVLNVGLALLGEGSVPEAIMAFERARELLDPKEAGAQAAAAARELGGALLLADDPESACDVFEDAVRLARSASDHGTLAGAANGLGLARLRRDELPAAVEAFQEALAASPRSVRPEGYALVQANMALALEQVGDPTGARLAARHALGVAVIPPDAAAQCHEVVDRLGADDDVVLTVLDTVDADRWPALLRHEVALLVDLPEERRREEMARLVTGFAARPERLDEIAVAWIGVIVELPPEQLQAVVEDMLVAAAQLDPDDADSVRSAMRAASFSLHAPQALRVEQVFADASDALQAGA